MRCGRLAVIHGAVLAKLCAGEAVEAYRLAQWSIDLVGGDPVKGRTASIRFTAGSFVVLSRAGGMQLGSSGLARRHAKRYRHAALCRRDTGWRCRRLSAWLYVCGMLNGALLPDDDAVRETAEALRIAEERGDDVALELGARCSRAGA